MGPARIKCDTKPIRKGDSGWIIGFKGKGDWYSNGDDDKPKQQTGAAAYAKESRAGDLDESGAV